MSSSKFGRVSSPSLEFTVKIFCFKSKENDEIFERKIKFRGLLQNYSLVHENSFCQQEAIQYRNFDSLWNYPYVIKLHLFLPWNNGWLLWVHTVQIIIRWKIDIILIRAFLDWYLPVVLEATTGKFSTLHDCIVFQKNKQRN